jgi:hypothetical protein
MPQINNNFALTRAYQKTSSILIPDLGLNPGDEIRQAKIKIT